MADLHTVLADLPGNVVVMRDGEIIHASGEVEKPIFVYSVSKSLTALVAGRLLHEGVVTLDEEIGGSNVSANPPATLRQFMSMTSDYGLVPHAPGQHYAYNNQAVHVYGSYLAEYYHGGKDPLTVLRQEVLDPIGIEDPSGYNGLWGGWGGGFELSARDIARIGLLVLNEGRWENRQLLSAEFIDALYRCQIPEDATAATDNGPDQEGDNTVYNQQAITADLPGNYAYGWWTNANGQYPNLPRGVTAASGLYGNYIIVSPEQRLVIAVTSTESPYPKYADYLSAVLSTV